MAIYRGPGGAGDATNDATSQAILAAASAANAAVSATAAAASASSAATSATAAASSATNAASSATSATSSANSASTSATNAATSATAAQTAQTAAETAKTAAETAETNAETAETNAETAASLAQDWAIKLVSPVSGSDYSSKYNANLAAASATSAATSATSASTSASSASTYASNASTSATNAASSASAASTSATNAASSATSASTSASTATTAASTATTQATNAASSATAAATSASNASTSATNAASSATSAAGSASTATTKAAEASTSATAAAASATAAATSESNADISEANAASSETAAASSATSAAASATSATNSASTATTQATNAASSASAAATSASNAATSETNAAGSATSAASSATSASSSATSASNSASSASTSATNAAASAIDAQSSEDAAAAYASSINPANFLAKANNLSDLSNTSTARTNLGLGTAATMMGPTSTIVGTADTQTLTNKTLTSPIINGTGVTFNDGSSQQTAASGFGFKNRIINGDMRIDQRNAGASVTPTGGAYIIDRFQYVASQASKVTAQQNAGAVTLPVGFTKYLGITSSSAYTVGAAESFLLVQKIEGQNVSDLAWGTASALAVTLSFKVYSSLTGTFGGVLTNSAQDRSYPFTYTVSSANTWTSVSITIAGDTSGTWLTTNGIGIRVIFSLGAGATVSGTSGAWAGATYLSATGATSVVGTNGATFYITGVQLEKGSTATSFDYRPYGTELALCQRYYQFIGGSSAATSFPLISGYVGGAGDAWYAAIPFPVQMRTTPTVTKNGTWGGANAGQPAALQSYTNSQGLSIQFAITAAGRGYIYPNSDDDTITCSAEL